MKKKLYFLILSIFITFIFIACGGGGGGGGGDDGGNGVGATPPVPDSYILMIIQKAGGAFGLGDLEGTWNYHGLVSGDAPQQQPGWYHGKADIDAHGKVTQSQSDYLDSDGNTTPPLDSELALSANGIVTDTADQSLNGAMNLDTDMMVITRSDTGFHLEVLQKQMAGVTFDLNDFSGTWNNHCVVSGDTQWLGWERGILGFDKSGIFGFIEYASSDPGRTAVPMKFDISADGIITENSNTSIHGVMNAGKDLMLITIDDVHGGYKLCVLQKAVASATSQSDLEGIWNFHGLSTGDAPEWTGWFNGQLTADANGSVTQFTYTVSDNSTIFPGPLDLNIMSNGTVTETGNPTFHGSMNIGLDLIVSTMD